MHPANRRIEETQATPPFALSMFPNSSSMLILNSVGAARSSLSLLSAVAQARYRPCRVDSRLGSGGGDSCSVQLIALGLDATNVVDRRRRSAVGMLVV